MKVLKYVLILTILGGCLRAAAQISCTTDYVDFGKIYETDGEKTVRIHIRNDSDKPLSLLRVRPTCGCTAADYYKGEFAPGDSAWIDLTYNPNRRPGYFEKGVRVTPSEGETIRIPISGTVFSSQETIENMFPSDGGLLHLTERTIVTLTPLAGGERTLFVDAYNSNEAPVYTLVRSDSPAVETQVFPPIIPPGEKANIGIYIYPDKEARTGQLEYTLTLYTSLSPDNLLDGEPVVITVKTEKNF